MTMETVEGVKEEITGIKNTIAANNMIILKSRECIHTLAGDNLLYSQRVKHLEEKLTKLEEAARTPKPNEVWRGINYNKGYYAVITGTKDKPTYSCFHWRDGSNVDAKYLKATSPPGWEYFAANIAEAIISMNKFGLDLKRE